MSESYSLGIDFGTSSVRALIVHTASGREVGTAFSSYPHGQAGVLLDTSVVGLARQRPADHLSCLQECVLEAIENAGPDFDAHAIIGIGVDATGSSPLPLDASGQPLAFDERFKNDLNAQVWLWKDHTGHEEAATITAKAREMRPEYLVKCGGIYSAEWFWAKAWHCLNVSPEVFSAAHTWVEYVDWIPAVLTGTDQPDSIRRGICAAGHKAMYHESWGGFPDQEFIAALDPDLLPLRESLPTTTYSIADKAGDLIEEWAQRFGMPAGIPVAIGAFDAHLGGVGSGVRPGTLVKIIGTSTCDILTAPLESDLPDIPGLCGIVPESVLPKNYGLEAGQSGVGDIFNWLVEVIRPDQMDHDALTAGAETLVPGESGLLALDWHNGNRTVLVDQRLTGLILGMSTHSTPAQIYRSLIEATAFGARIIIDRFEEYGISIDQVISCGGGSAKNALLLQIYADVLNRPMHISGSTETCALGAAIAGSVAAGSINGGWDAFEDAIDAMTSVRDERFDPIPENVKTYDTLFGLYKELHDAFGITGTRNDLSGVMKTLLNLRDKTSGDN